MVKNPYKVLSPDPDHLRGRSSHGHNTSCVNKIKSIGAIVFELRDRTDIRTNPNALHSHSSPGASVIMCGYVHIITIGLN